MTSKLKSIEVTFPVPVDLPEGWEQKLGALVDEVCELHEEQHPGRIMWAAGFGSKVLWREPAEPDFDDSVYSIDVAERAGYPEELKRRQRRKDRRIDELEMSVATVVAMKSLGVERVSDLRDYSWEGLADAGLGPRTLKDIAVTLDRIGQLSVISGDVPESVSKHLETWRKT